MKGKLLIYLGFCFLPQVVMGGETERRQLAEEIMNAQGLPEQIAEVQTRFTQAASGEVEGLELGEEHKKLAQKERKAVLEELARELDWTSIKDGIVDIYASEYTEKELLEIRDFLVSPAGKKYREKIPLIKDRINGLAREKMLTALPEILIRASKRLAEKNDK